MRHEFFHCVATACLTLTAVLSAAAGLGSDKPGVGSDKPVVGEARPSPRQTAKPSPGTWKALLPAAPRKAEHQSDFARTLVTAQRLTDVGMQVGRGFAMVERLKELGSQFSVVRSFAIELFSGNKAHLWAGNKAALLSGNRSALLSGNRAKILSGNQAPIASDNHCSLYSNLQFDIHIGNSFNAARQPPQK
jgi:hypothetical protein